VVSAPFCVISQSFTRIRPDVNPPLAKNRQAARHPERGRWPTQARFRLEWGVWRAKLACGHHL